MTAVLLIAWLHHPAVAGPEAAEDSSYDPGAAPLDSAQGTPWIDRGPALALSTRSDQSTIRDRKLASALTLGGLYVGFIGWTYFAWYRTENHAFQTGGDGTWKVWKEEGWFGSQRYAGGADKMGHAWATLALGRAGTEMLSQWGGHSRLTSALIGMGLSEALFLGVEIKDGFAYRFSYGDFTFNTLGALLGLAQSLSPRFDELVDLRVQYAPSDRYQEKFVDGDVDVAEDYSGQTYLLALHLGGIHRLRDARWGGWSRFVDVSLGFESRGYKPDPPYKIDPTDPARMDYPKRQSTFIGISLNAQGLFAYLLRGRAEGWRKITHGAFEVFSLPYTTLPAIQNDVRPTGAVPDDQN